MARTPKLYTRLTRNASGVGSYTCLWLGPDHLMIVTSTGYSESYSRLLFRDVKGFFVTSSDRRLGWGIAWGAISFALLIIAIAQFMNRGSPLITGIFLGLSLGLLTWNHLLGPGCYTYVFTGVQTVRLPSLVRRKKALQVLGRVQPLIEAAQADLVAPSPQPPTLPAPTPLMSEIPVAHAGPVQSEVPPVVPAPPPTPPSLS